MGTNCLNSDCVETQHQPRLGGALGGPAELAPEICHSERVQSKWQRETGDVQRKPGVVFQGSPVVESHRV